MGNTTRLGERILEAIAKAEYEQSEREKIQDTYKSHRKHLDKYARAHQYDTNIDMEQNAIQELNQLLRAAGCTDFLNTNFTPTCKIGSDSEVCQWNKLLPLHAEYIEAGSPWQDIIMDDRFHGAIVDTVKSLEAIGRSMIYQRSKHRRLRIRHAALTLSTSALSKILLSKAGDAPEPQHVIFDEALGRKRPCKTIEECLLATNIKEQAYMIARP